MTFQLLSSVPPASSRSPGCSRGAEQTRPPHRCGAAMRPYPPPCQGTCSIGARGCSRLSCFAPDTGCEAGSCVCNPTRGTQERQELSSVPCHRSSQHPDARQRLDQQVPVTKRPAATPGSTRETQPSPDHGSCHRLPCPELAPHRGLPAAALGKAGGRDRHTAGRARAFRKTRVLQGEPRYASASNRCGWPRPSSPTTSLTPLSETRSVSRSLLQVKASLGELQAGARPLKSKVNHI